MRLLESRLYKDDLKRAIGKVDLTKLDGKNIFITGGLGLICSAIVDILVIYGKVEKIYVGARSLKQFQCRFGGISGVEYVQYDALEKMNLDIQPDYIIHGAGLASPELYVSNPVETILSNFDGVHTLLEFSKSNNVKRLLYISSSEVYGNRNSENRLKEKNYGEINIDNIRSSYAIAKKASEMLCKAYFSEFGVETVIVRPGHIYGPSAKESDKRVSSEFAFKAARGEKIELKSNGMQKRSYCYSIDCAVQILTVLLKGENGQSYNIGNDKVTTIREIAEIYAKAGKVELATTNPVEIEQATFNPMDNAALDNNKVKQFGYSDAFSVEEGVQHTVYILKELYDSSNQDKLMK